MDDPDKILPFPKLREIDAQAAEWIVKLEEGEMSAEETAAFLAWQNTSDQHRDAFAAMLNMWSDLDILEELQDYAEAVKHDEMEARSERSRLVFGVSRRAAMSGLAASVVGAAVLAAGLYYAPGFLNPDNGDYITAVGEQKRIELNDGSIIELNTNSQVQIRYERLARNITLLKGEAHFEVAPDKERPFSVTARNNRVTAVGTAFSVHLTDKQIEVVVAQGKVALSALDKSLPAKARKNPNGESLPLAEITVGQKAIAERDLGAVELLDPQALSRELSWRQGVLSFEGEPLHEVIADISRYTDTQIDIKDAVLREMPVAGYFRVGETDAMLEALEVMADIQVEHVNKNHVRISSRASE